MRALVTGGAGFIGSAVVRNLVGIGAEVATVDKLTYAGHRENLASVADNPRHTFHQLDICDGQSIGELVSSFQPDAIVHLAAETHVDRSIDGPRAFIETNIIGTYTLLEAAREHMKGRDDFRFLHVSTDEVFGSLGETGQFTESSPYQPNSPYSASKASSDHLVRAWHETFGLPIVLTNCSNNYGPFQFPEKLVPLTIFNALEGRSIGLYGDGLQVRDWLFVEDHAEGIVRVLERGTPGETYNIGGDSERRNRDVVDTILRSIATHADRDLDELRKLVSYVPDRPGHDQRYAIDASKIRRELNWGPSLTFERGMDATVRWYLENAEWRNTVMSAYDGQRLGLTGGETENTEGQE